MSEGVLSQKLRPTGQKLYILSIKSSERKEAGDPGGPRQCKAGRLERKSSQKRMLVGAGSQGHASGQKPGLRSSLIHHGNHVAQEWQSEHKQDSETKEVSLDLNQVQLSAWANPKG